VSVVTKVCFVYWLTLLYLVLGSFLALRRCVMIHASRVFTQSFCKNAGIVP
jgi:hypothetical protein